MTQPANTKTSKALLAEAQQQLQQGAVIKAMQIYYDLHERDPQSTEILCKLVGINLHMQIYDQAIVNLQKLIQLEPLESDYYDQLAQVYGSVSDWEEACETCYGLILRKPTSPEAHFNLAFYLRRAGKFEESVDSYERALKHGISQAEEVHLNIAVIYADDLRKESRAEEQLRKALDINPQYIPALYNLANLYEDRGDREKTIELFRQILAIEPTHARALARLAPLTVVEPATDPLLKRLYDVVGNAEVALSDRIDALYGLGKTHNDCGEYDPAFANYRAANELSRGEMPPYDKQASERHFDRIIDTVSADWMAENHGAASEQPIFICGMFRSGSTLVEQILAAHPQITPGGERDTFTRELRPPKLQYPEGLAELDKDTLQQMAARYLEQSRALFPDAMHITDKRPDNFLYVGLIKTLFPNAKFVYTSRQALDNCLSVYFVRLGRAMNYATDLDNIAHYYDQQVRLREHWQSLLGDELHVLDYDELVHNPRPVVEKLLAYLGLEWHDSCLEFHELRNTVKTASVWQVREPLYTISSGRWQNYEKHLAGLIGHFSGAGLA